MKDLQKQLAKQRKGEETDVKEKAVPAPQPTESMLALSQENEALIKRAQYFQDEVLNR